MATKHNLLGALSHDRLFAMSIADCQLWAITHFNAYQGNSLNKATLITRGETHFLKALTR